MLHLVELTKPGPFSAGAIELGSYLGIRYAGKLIAMAGERMRFDGFTEFLRCVLTQGTEGVVMHPRWFVHLFDKSLRAARRHFCICIVIIR